VLKTITHDLRLSFAAFLELGVGHVVPRARIGTIPEQVMTELTDEVAKVDGTLGPMSEVFLSTLGAKVVCARLYNRAPRPWVACFGPRTDDDPLHREDIETVQTLTGQLSTIIEKLQLLEDLEEKSQELREMNRRLVETQEEERTRISAYLHDEPVQKLSYLLSICGDCAVPEGFEDVLRQAVDELRNFAVMLRPAILDDLGLVRALEWLAAENSARSGTPVSFVAKGINRDDRFGRDVELALYRVAQEALTNCEKHARPSLIRITLTQEAKCMALKVVDNGVGIRSPESGETRWLGIACMRERAEQVGGTFSIRRRKASGTIVEVFVPLKQDAKAGSS